MNRRDTCQPNRIISMHSERTTHAKRHIDANAFYAFLTGNSIVSLWHSISVVMFHLTLFNILPLSRRFWCSQILLRALLVNHQRFYAVRNEPSNDTSRRFMQNLSKTGVNSQ